MTPQVRCTLCRHRFSAPAVAVCPECGGRYIKLIGPVTMTEHLVISLRNSAVKDGRDDEAAILSGALREAGVE